MSSFNNSSGSGGATSTTTAITQQPKHRACDECRTRKLACSKEPDGCARCKREKIVCHYSPQKPMGRPRKRPRDDAVTAEQPRASKNVMTEVPPDIPDPGLAFLTFLVTGEGGAEYDAGEDATAGIFDDVDPQVFTSMDVDNDISLTLPPPRNTHHGNTSSKSAPDWQFGEFMGQDLGQLNFDTNPNVDHSPSFSSANLDPALFLNAQTPPDAAAVPNLSSGSSSSPDSSSSNEEASPPVTTPLTCACTASLYLAIDSMQKLSVDITAAVREARLATKTAYEVVNCPVCGANEPPTGPPVLSAMIQNFQNLMLLATLIPSIVNAYERILVIVDQEAARAQSERREIAVYDCILTFGSFTLQEYGGLWIKQRQCNAKTFLTHRMMEPMMWRLTLRALLKVDVYGLQHDRVNYGASSASSADPFFIGLKDIVVQMESRSRARHAIMDTMILSGAWEDTQHCALKLHRTGEKPTCQRIIEIARQSLDNLVIA